MSDGQTLQKACKIDYSGNISVAEDPNRRTDPDKNLSSVEQTQKPILCLVSNAERPIEWSRTAPGW